MRYSTIPLIVLILALAATIVHAGPTIIITEVFYDAPTPESLNEWIELYNPTTSPVNIGGYKILDNYGVYTIISGTVMSPGQVLTFARSIGGFNSMYGFDPDVGDLNLFLANTGDFLILKDATGTQIDMVAWEGGKTGWDLIADEGETIQRHSLAQGAGAWLSNRTPNPGDPAPIPEPTTMVLLGLGLLGVLGLSRKFRKPR